MMWLDLALERGLWLDRGDTVWAPLAATGCGYNETDTHMSDTLTPDTDTLTQRMELAALMQGLGIDPTAVIPVVPEASTNPGGLTRQAITGTATHDSQPMTHKGRKYHWADVEGTFRVRMVWQIEGDYPQPPVSKGDTVSHRLAKGGWIFRGKAD